MQTLTGAAAAMRQHRLVMALVLAAPAAAALLSHGTSGGDEDGVLSFLSFFDRGGWQAVLARFPDNVFLAHRLFWLVEKLAWDGLLHAILPPSLFAPPTLNTWWLVLDGPLLMTSAFCLLAWHLLRQGYHWSIALLAPSAVLVASSASGLFTGGLSECLMAFLVAALAMLADRQRPPSWLRLALFAACAAMLVVTKLYAAPFALLLCFGFPGGARRMAGMVFIFLAPFAWLLLQSRLAGAAHQGSMLSFYLQLMKVFQPVALLREAGRSLFSLSFGILPCFPLLLFAAWAPAARHRMLLLKLAGVFSILVMLLPFGFWYGTGGLAGPRYIAPFLLVFIPEIAAGMARLAASARGKRALLLVPVAALLFLPSMDYRNGLLERYTNGAISNTDMDWTHGEVDMHPGVFGWRVVLAQALGPADFRLGRARNLSVPANEIFPMTGISRIVYVLHRHGSGPKEAHAAWVMLGRYGLDHELFWRIGRMILIVLLLGTLVLAAARAQAAER